jgi:hypothetical protein
MKVGFRPKKLIANYLHDPVCDNYGILIVKENPLLASTLDGQAAYRNSKFKTNQ